MADKPTPGEFKTSLMGFQKAQVLAYIDELSAKALESQKQQEQAAEALRKELENAKADNDVLLEKTKEVCDRLTSEEKRAGEAESRARAISEQLLHMEETANGYKSRLFTKEQETVVLRADNARLTEQLEQQHKQLEQALADLEAARAEGEEKARHGREELERQRSAFEEEKQADLCRMEQEKADAQRQMEQQREAAQRQMEQQREAAQRELELEKARFDQTRRTQQESARQSAQQMADTVLLLRSQLEQVDRQIAEAAERLQKATGAIYTALGETEQNLVTLGAQADSFPKPLPEQPAPPKAQPRPERDKRPPRRPARRRTVSESLLDLLERALKE